MADLKNKSLCFVQISKGNKEAFDAFFKHYYPKLIQFAHIYISCPQQAEDVVADVLTNMLIHRERVFALEHFEAYLYSSLKNKALSSIKRNHRMDPYPSGSGDFKPMAKTVSDPHELLVEQELRSRINQIVLAFPPKRKMVYQFIKEDGFSYRHVAELMDISERTVEVHLKLAVKALRQGIEDYLDRKKEKKAVKDLVKVLVPMFLFVL